MATEITVELDAVDPVELICSGYGDDNSDPKYQRTPDNVWLRIDNPCGPGGGWPVVKIRGERGAVLAYVEEHWGIDAFEMLLSEGY